jgi:hypothetical protein
LTGENEVMRKEINKIDDEFFTFRDRIKAMLDIRK